MKRFRMAHCALVAAAALVSGAALAQGSTSLSGDSPLTQPNNSAGSMIGTPPAMPSAAVATTKPTTPTRTESALSAFDKLDANRRGYVTRADVAQLPGNLDFEGADRNRDGRLDRNEFEHFWGIYESGSK